MRRSRSVRAKPNTQWNDEGMPSIADPAAGRLVSNLKLIAETGVKISQRKAPEMTLGNVVWKVHIQKM